MGDVTNDGTSTSAEGGHGKADGARAAVPRTADARTPPQPPVLPVPPAPAPAPASPAPPRLLPPIGNGETAGTCSGRRTPAPSPAPAQPGQQPRSRFHGGCSARAPPSIYLDWSAVRTGNKAYTHYTGKIPKRGKARSMTSFKDAEEQEVLEYLENNKGFLESYVAERVPEEVLEKWLFAKMKRNDKKPSVSPSEQQLVPHRQKDNICKKQVFTELLKVLKEDPSEHAVLLELARYIVTSVGVDAYRVYKLYPDHPSFVQYFVMESDQTSSQEATSKRLRRAEPGRAALVLEVARGGGCRRLARPDDPLRFPAMRSRNKNVKEAHHVMYQPILTKASKTTYVIEMWRARERFRERDEQVSSDFLVLGSLALHYCNLYLDKKRERNMSDFLLDVVKAIFEEMVSLDQLIKRILEFAQRLVNADRASLFLVDYRNFELVSTVFDLKFEPGHDRDMEKKEIRMPINRGIAGHVALSGETMNIPDAYSDYRFNREVDEATGYKTVSILCMPIKVEGRIIGVVQMVNKRNDDNFGHEDEAAFEIFSTFFGLALHHARLYDRIMRKEQKYRVALEVLSYHNTCRETEVQKMLSDKDPISIDLNDFYLDPFKLDEFQKCKCVISMFKDLFDLSRFDIMTLTRFVLTVKKNYRTVPYHNFDHGWSVAHAMYVILKGDHRKRYNYKMRVALFVACLCHDLDHRGYTNKYMSEIASPLAAMYTTSTLEHHHFNITVTILQQDGHNIFSHISSEDYKEILSCIRHCILATDLAAFFPNLDKMRDLQSEGSKQQFCWTVNNHRELAMAISMTAADLSASAKPWDIQIKTVQVIFEEFYEQGDKERQAGRQPIPMMDRERPGEQPASQVGFLSQICIPCYDILYRILPNTKPMFTMALKNLDRWKSRADRVLRGLLDDKTDSGDDSEATMGTLLLEQEIEDLTDDETAARDVQVRVTNQESVVIEVKRGSVTWAEEEVEGEETPRSGIWKEIDGATWMDEEGVVVNKKTLKAIVD